MAKSKQKHNRTLINTADKFEKEGHKQLSIVFPASAIVMWRMGWRKERIFNRMAVAQQEWLKCAEAGISTSMLQMFEDETGIDLAIEGYDSYHDCVYLDWDGTGNWSAPYRIAVLQKQAKWIPTMLIASIGIALHRVDGFGVNNDSEGRMKDFICAVDDVRRTLGENPKAYARALLEETNGVIQPGELMAVI